MHNPSSLRSRIVAAALVLVPVAALVAAQPAAAQSWSDNHAWSGRTAGQAAPQRIGNTPRTGTVDGRGNATQRVRSGGAPVQAVPPQVVPPQAVAPQVVYPQVVHPQAVYPARQLTWPFGFVTAANAEANARAAYAAGNHVGNDLP